MTLRDSEVGLVVAIEVLGGQATTEEIADYAGMNIDYVRNLVGRLRTEGIIESVSAAVGFGFLGGRKGLAGREKINVLYKPIGEVIEENQDEFLKWSRLVLKATTKQDLLKKIEALKKQAEGRKKS